IASISWSQACYWQQKAIYKMNIEMDVRNNCMSGYQHLTYINNSPDVLKKVYYHLYYNAFQPNSMMDVRSRTIPDPDRRIQDRISKLDEDEIGFHKIKSLEQDGAPVQFFVDGTILEVRLADPIRPGEETQFVMEFESQVPLQIRRTGRDNREGIEYSMSQWYPKICEYDEDGWHPNPYIAREFYGVWGDFDVTIEIDKDYIVAAGGVLLNEPEDQKGRKRQWHYRAENVHDFVWAADPDYVHEVLVRESGTKLHFYYQPGERTTDNWKAFQKVMDETFDFANEHYGQYPYPEYAFIQGGDGGMEYAMATLITGKRSFMSLVAVGVHEVMHSWYHMVLGTNESLYPWMDEGFTNYTEAMVINHLKRRGLIPGFDPLDDPMASAMTGYRNFAKTPLEEPLITHADHYQRNQAHGIAAYIKGSIFLHQLSYIIGRPALDTVMLDYFNRWKFKHPDANDFIRIAERESDMILDWYQEYWINSTHKIDYGIDSVFSGEQNTTITLERIGNMPMPIDLVVYLKEGRTYMYHIPLRMMRGAKPDEGLADHYLIKEDWPWTHPVYSLVIGIPFEDIESIEIDPSNRLADIDLTNNFLMMIDASDE
ncbi:MAG: M1 family metallopeptidase, partial [Saprospiraceae bacterium]|nr:M1 family metallopeptidase [Saprospiraceae bacterium]